MQHGSSQSSSTAAPVVSVELRVPHSFYSHLLITLTVGCFHIWLLIQVFVFICVACTIIKLRAYRPMHICTNMFVVIVIQMLSHILTSMLLPICAIAARSNIVVVTAWEFLRRIVVCGWKITVDNHTLKPQWYFCYKFQLHSNNISQQCFLRYSLLRCFIEFLVGAQSGIQWNCWQKLRLCLL